MIQKEFPEHYGKPVCPVPVKDYHNIRIKRLLWVI